VDALSQLRPLSAQRRQRLDELLANGGKDVFIFDPQLVTGELIRSNVSDHGVLRSRPSLGEREYFVVGNGRIEVGDTSAVFIPAAGSDAELVEVHVPAQDEPVQESADGPPAGAQSGAGGVTTPATMPVRAAGNPFFGISTVAATLAVLDALLGAGLAAFLLIAGLMVLRDSLRGATLHRIYAWLKIPLAILGAVVWVWLWESLFSGVTASVPPQAAGGPQGAAAVRTGAIIHAIVFTALGCAYPIALLIALRTRSVRAYYQSEDRHG
jgi:hypothetical protein